MDPLETISRAPAYGLELRPGLSPAEVERVAAEVGAPLSRELRRLLERTAGIDGGPLETIDFTGRSLSFGAAETFPWGLPIAGDGSGNFWIVDLTPPEVDVAPVFFASHDPPVILYQSPDLDEFLQLLVPPHASALDDVHEDRLFNVWRDNPGTLEHSAALAGDEQLSSFAAELDDRFTFVDLRSPPVGMGFSWGRYGPRTELRRHGCERLFAYAPPEKKPGLLRRLLA
jgi:hypothetical protein